MSDSSAAFPTDFDRFRQIWDVDFEYQPDSCGLPWPTLMVPKERRSSRIIIVRGHGRVFKQSVATLPARSCLIDGEQRLGLYGQERCR